jgi:hypothetical protein
VDATHRIDWRRITIDGVGVTRRNGRCECSVGSERLRAIVVLFRVVRRVVVAGARRAYRAQGRRCAIDAAAVDVVAAAFGSARGGEEDAKHRRQERIGVDDAQTSLANQKKLVAKRFAKGRSNGAAARRRRNRARARGRRRSNQAGKQEKQIKSLAATCFYFDCC